LHILVLIIELGFKGSVNYAPFSVVSMLRTKSR